MEGAKAVTQRSPISALAKKETYVIDTSVALKWFYQEEEKAIDNALKLRDDYRQRKIDLRAPALLLFELANVLRYKQDLEERYIQGAVESIYKLQLIEQVSQEVTKEAVRIALQFESSVYDAVYLALAEKNRCPFITADNRFYQRVKNRPLVIFIDDYGE
jgi:Predicted nucleic acid-binding protein, contains PIN domain